MKKFLLVVICVVLLLGCAHRELDTIYSDKDTLKFMDENGYVLTIHYSDSLVEDAEWVIVTDSEEDADKLIQYYSDKIEMFDATLDGTTVILKYTEEYLDETFGSVTKDEMEEYLGKKGYELIKE